MVIIILFFPIGVIIVIFTDGTYVTDNPRKHTTPAPPWQIESVAFINSQRPIRSTRPPKSYHLVGTECEISVYMNVCLRVRAYEVRWYTLNSSHPPRDERALRAYNVAVQCNVMRFTRRDAICVYCGNNYYYNDTRSGGCAVRHRINTVYDVPANEKCKYQELLLCAFT